MMRRNLVCSLALFLFTVAASATPVDPGSAHLTARPLTTVDPAHAMGLGLHWFNFSQEGRDGLIYVPASYKSAHPAPLMLFLHPNRGDKTSALDLVRDQADRTGTVLVIPESKLRSWDRYMGGAFGPDLATVDRGLQLAFSSLSIDLKHIAIAGFSDGASYSLSVGQTNGDLFTHIIALSPCDNVPSAQVGRPPVFIMQGTLDDVLPIDQCARVIVPALRKDGYAVSYQEFVGSHLVIDQEKQLLFAWFLGENAAASAPATSAK